jgi:flagellar motility protein MotE (MotC chaperone)
MKQPRLVPMVIVAASALLGLKVLAFMHGDLTVRAAEIAPGSARDPFAGKPIDPIITGSGHDAPPADAGGHGAAAAPPPEGVKPSVVPAGVSSARPEEAKPIPGTELLSEIEVLKRLSERRKQLDKLEGDLLMRENLLKATEERVEKKVDDLKQLETKTQQAVKSGADDPKKQMGDLVKMYESMKPKDAARVFDGLEIRLLVDIGKQMNPKKLGDIVSKMSPETAQKLTVELARQNAAPQGQAPDNALPKIQGKL